MRRMPDACTPSNIPDGFDLVAYYVDGVCAAPPVKGTVHVGISALATDAGVVGDCEPENPPPATWVSWVVRRRAAGVDPTIYCADDSLSAFFDGFKHRDVRAAFHAAGVPEPHYWLILLGATAVPAGAVAAQVAQGLDGDRYDLSLVADYWPGVDPAPAHNPPPAPPEEDDMTGPVAFANPFNGQPHVFQVRQMVTGIEHWWQVGTTWQKPEVLPGSADKVAAGTPIYASTTAVPGQLQVWAPLADGSGSYHAWQLAGAGTWSWEVVS